MEFEVYSGEMEVNQIKFQDDLPSEVTVTMSIAEAVAIAKVFGAMNGHAHRKLGIAPHDYSPYSALVGSVLNPYWENGLAEFGLEISLDTLNSG